MKGFYISLVVAASRNGVIGLGGDLPWHLPSDLSLFKAITLGKAIIMGRRTWDSLHIRPLPDRYNIVLTRDRDWQGEGAVCAHCFDSALDLAFSWSRDSGTDEICIIGGGNIYAQALSLADKIYFSRIDADFSGDVFFTFDESDWILEKKTHYNRDSRNSHDFDYLEYRR